LIILIGSEYVLKMLISRHSTLISIYAPLYVKYNYQRRRNFVERMTFSNQNGQESFFLSGSVFTYRYLRKFHPFWIIPANGVQHEKI